MCTHPPETSLGESFVLADPYAHRSTFTRGSLDCEAYFELFKSECDVKYFVLVLLSVHSSYQHTLPTHPLNSPHHCRHCSHVTQPTTSSYKHTLLTNTPCHLIGTPSHPPPPIPHHYRHCSHVTQPTTSSYKHTLLTNTPCHLIGTPSQHTFQHTLSTHPPSLQALFPCPHDHVMILHNNAGGDVMASDPLLKHACEYMLLVDKVKDTAQMWKIYNATTSHRNSYHDFSAVLR